MQKKGCYSLQKAAGGRPLRPVPGPHFNFEMKHYLVLFRYSGFDSFEHFHSYKAVIFATGPVPTHTATLAKIRGVTQKIRTKIQWKCVERRVALALAAGADDAGCEGSSG